VFVRVSQHVQSEELGVKVALDAELARRRRRSLVGEDGVERGARDATKRVDLGSRPHARVAKFGDDVNSFEETRIDDAQIEDGRGVDGG